MKMKIINFLICLLFITTNFSIIVIAGSEYDPEIIDDEENDIVEFLDIISAWFYEKEDEPEYLFTGLKLKKIETNQLKQHLTVHWEHNDIYCAASLHIGYDEKNWISYQAGYGHGFWFQEHYQSIEGNYDKETGIIECKIPKSIINNPKKDDVLTNTYALTFQRFGFIGRLGFDRWFIRSLISIFIGKHLNDIAPNEENGKDYIIQY
jgi:hypothetical protein